RVQGFPFAFAPLHWLDAELRTRNLQREVSRIAVNTVHIGQKGNDAVPLQLGARITAGLLKAENVMVELDGFLQRIRHDHVTDETRDFSRRRRLRKGFPNTSKEQKDAEHDD